MLKNLVLQARSFRRFDEKVVVPVGALKQFVDIAHYAPSAKNGQPLKYILGNNKSLNHKIFGTLSWAGYLKDWKGPAEGERPTGYIVILGDKQITEDFSYDPGIAAQTIMLAAAEAGYGGCIVGSVDREALAEILELPDHFEILLVMAFGIPAEKVALETAEDGKIEYWRDEDSLHHVPKRPLDEIIYSEIHND